MREGHKLSLRGLVLHWLVPLGISGLAIWLVLRGVELSELVENLRKIDPRTYVLASLLYLSGLLFRVFCWYLLLRRRVSFKDTFFVMSAGYLLNNVFPFRLGEVGRALLLGDPEGPSSLEVLSSILVERILDVFLAALFFLSMLPHIVSPDADQRLIVAALALAVVGLGTLFIIVRFRLQILGWLVNWGERTAFVKNWLEPKVRQVLQGLEVLNKPGIFLLASGSLVVSWLLAFSESYVVFQSLSPGSPFWWMVFVLSAGAFGAALPSAPAALGVFEGVMVAAFVLLGVNPGLALTHAIVVHVIGFVFNGILGLIGLRLRGQALFDLYHRAVHRSPGVTEME